MTLTPQMIVGSMYRDKKSNHSMYLYLCSHAIEQAQLRGVPIEAVLLAARYGRVCHLPKGYRIRLLDRRIIDKVMRTGLLPQIKLEWLAGTALVTHDSGSARAVVTTLPKEKEGSLREVYRRAKAAARKHYYNRHSQTSSWLPGFEEVA